MTKPTHSADAAPAKVAQHSPGTWESYVNKGKIEVWARESIAARSLVAQVFGDFDDEQEANARLIASAPELLAACKLAEADLGPDGGDKDPWNAYHALCKAIAKAEGREA